MPMTIIWRESIAPEPTVFWGAEIKRMRQTQRLSQRRLADLAGIDRGSLVRFEDGKSRGNMELVEKVIGVLGYEIDMMWCGFVGGTLQPRLPLSLSHRLS
ncbi:MAG: helix-turn-helix transcriptional regulator [Reyranellaceae bacterium]